MRKGSAVYVDRFTAGLDDLTRQEQADPAAVLRVLERTGRFSCFEAGENPTIARTITRLLEVPETVRGGVRVGRNRIGAIIDQGTPLVRATGGEYPWTTVELTEAGRALIAAPHPHD